MTEKIHYEWYTIVEDEWVSRSEAVDRLFDYLSHVVRKKHIEDEVTIQVRYDKRYLDGTIKIILEARVDEPEEDPKPKYEEKQIEPRRYPDVKPDKEYDKVWVMVHSGWTEFWWSHGTLTWDGVKWWIPVGGAPEELKPMLYGPNKPKEKGEYWAHFKQSDEWVLINWHGHGTFTWRNLVDWWIPYNLKPERAEK